MSKAKAEQTIPPRLGSINCFHHLPPSIERLFKCPGCPKDDNMLIRADDGWVCPNFKDGAGHIGIKKDGILIDELEHEIDKIFNKREGKAADSAQRKLFMANLLLELLWHRAEIYHRKRK